MKHLFLLILYTVLFSATAEVITIDLPCDKTEKIVKYIKEDYKESLLIMGNVDDNAASVMTFWMNKKTKSWTILATKDDITCVIGTGTNIKLILGLDL